MPGLRVAVDVTPLAGVRSGVAQCVSNLLAVLPDVAPDIDVVPYVLSRRARPEATVLPHGTRHLRLPAAVAIRLWGMSDHPSVDAALDDVDVVHGTNFVVPPTSRPSTVTVHDAFCLVHPEQCSRAVRPFRRAVRRAIARGAWLHVSTRSMEEEMVALFGAGRIARIPFGVPPLGTSAALPPDVSPPYVLAIATLDRRKRHPHLVRAFASVASRHDGVRLVIAGADGNATGAVAAAIRALPPDARARVVMLGRVDESTRAALIRAATVLAYPSSDEGFGFPVLEAMSAGVPVVASDVGGIPEVSGGAALLVPVDDDTSGLADALGAVVTDGELRTRLQDAGRTRVRELSWEQHATGMAELWRRAAAAA